MRAGDLARPLVLFLGLAPLLAQETPAPPPPFSEQVEVEVVNVDAIVTDREGRAVTDLGRDDFVLRVDGAPVPIEYFAAPSGRAPLAATPPPSPPPPTPPTPLEPTKASAPPQSHLVIYVDQSALEVHDASRILDEIREFATTRLDGSVDVAIAAFTESLQVLAGRASTTGQVEEALTALAKFRGRGSIVKAHRNRLEADIRRSGMEMGITDSGRLANASASEKRLIETELRAFGEGELERQRRSIVALRQWVNALAGLEGRKAVLLATEGISANPLEYLEAIWVAKRAARGLPADRAPIESLRLQVLTDFETMLEAAQNARVAFYTISPRTSPVIQASAEFGSMGAEVALPPPRDRGVTDAASSVVRLAAATGGRALVLDDRLSDRLAVVADDEAAAYSLGFAASGPPSRSPHRITLTVTRPGLSVRHRETYRRRTLADRVEEALGAAISLQAESNPLDVELALGPLEAPQSRGKDALVMLQVRIPLSRVALVPSDGKLLATLVVRVATQDRRGIVGLGQPSALQVVVPSEHDPRVATDFWTYRARVQLAPGQHRIAVVIADPVSGLISSVTGAIEVPEAKSSHASLPRREPTSTASRSDLTRRG